MALSIDTRRIAAAELVPWEPPPPWAEGKPDADDHAQYGIAWKSTDGRNGAELIGKKADAERLLADIRKQAAANVTPIR